MCSGFECAVHILLILKHGYIPVHVYLMIFCNLVLLPVHLILNKMLFMPLQFYSRQRMSIYRVILLNKVFKHHFAALK